ncbi:MAG TPA: flagellar protein FlgN [Firmicutes bacterium]|nr:flagellar protein FlgN [Bacillota bacterium]
MGQEARERVGTGEAAVSLSPDLFQELLDLLASETEVVTVLLGAAEKAQKAIIEDDPAAIEAAAAEEADLFRELEEWESRRLRCMEGIEKELADAGFAKEDDVPLTLKKLAGLLPEGDRARLLEQGSKLRDVAFRLQEVNLLNAVLLRHSVTLNNYCLSLLTGDTGQTIYGEPGKRDRSGYQHGRLDARA